MRIVLTRRERLDGHDGVNIYLVALAQAFLDLGHEVTVVVGEMGDASEYVRQLSPRRKISIVALSRAPLSGVSSLLAWVNGAQHIRSLEPDLVIHSEAVPIPLPGTVVQVVNDLERRSGALAPLWRSIRRFAARRSDVVVATTLELREAIAGELGAPLERIKLIPKCVDLSVYHGLALQRRERAIFHSGTSPYKRPEDSIRAFGVLADPEATLYVAGDITSAVTQALGEIPARLRSRVVLLGNMDGASVRRVHGRVRIASFPTRYTIPVGSGTVIEAIACATPIVGSPRLSRDVLQDGVNGLRVEFSSEAMASAYRRLLDDDRLWSDLSAGARSMQARFDAERVAQAYLALVGAPETRRSSAA